MILDLQRLSRQSYTALHIVLATVSRSCVYHSVLLRISQNGLTTSLIDGIEVHGQLLLRQRVRIGTLRIHLVTYLVAHLVEVVCLIAQVTADGVASGIVEYHDVVELYFPQTFHATIVPMRPFNVRLALEYGQSMLRQRHGQRCLRDARTVADLRHKQVVTRQQRLLQRTGRNNVVLEKEQVDEIDSHQCKH